MKGTQPVKEDVPLDIYFLFSLYFFYLEKPVFCVFFNLLEKILKNRSRLKYLLVK